MHKRRKSVVPNATSMQNSKNLVIHKFAVRHWFYLIIHYMFKEKDY